MSWQPVIDSAALPPGGVAAARLDGTDVVVWRGRDGALGAMTRWCPHLDLDLADGFVDGNDLVCPGHGWSFTCAGRAQKRTEHGRVDDKGPVVHWQVRDESGTIQAVR